VHEEVEDCREVDEEDGESSGVVVDKFRKESDTESLSLDENLECTLDTVGDERVERRRLKSVTSLASDDVAADPSSFERA
jgi:hypothetical protein